MRTIGLGLGILLIALIAVVAFVALWPMSASRLLYPTIETLMAGAADVELGLIINFSERRLKDGLVRVLNPEKLNLQREEEGLDSLLDDLEGLSAQSGAAVELSTRFAGQEHTWAGRIVRSPGSARKTPSRFDATSVPSPSATRARTSPGVWRAASRGPRGGRSGGVACVTS